MPLFYAHDRFGTALLEKIPGEIRRSCTRFPQLFRVGLQGPDIFFFYNPLFRTAIGTLGHTAHSQSGQEFFTQAARAADTEAAQVYLYGLLAHYCLDSLCHPYVDAQTADGKIGHVEMESEFERFLLALDGIPSPETHPRHKTLKLTRGECVTAADFFPPAKPGHIYGAVKNAAWCIKMVCRPHGVMRRIVSGVIRNTADNVRHQMVPTRAEPKFRVSNGRLLELYGEALERYPVLLAQLTAHLRDGTPLGAEFDPIFG